MRHLNFISILQHQSHFQSHTQKIIFSSFIHIAIPKIISMQALETPWYQGWAWNTLSISQWTKFSAVSLLSQMTQGWGHHSSSTALQREPGNFGRDSLSYTRQISPWSCFSPIPACPGAFCASCWGEPAGSCAWSKLTILVLQRKNCSFKGFPPFLPCNYDYGSVQGPPRETFSLNTRQNNFLSQLILTYH